jgi:glycine C-acetyltransferase
MGLTPFAQLRGDPRMFGNMKKHIAEQLQAIRDARLYKSERIITSPQRARVSVLGDCPDLSGTAGAPREAWSRRSVKMGLSPSTPPERQGILNLCANNYLGLANHPEVVRAAHEALDRWGYGLASVRFICGTQQIHKDLERKLSEFLGTEDAILYSSCFDANGGLFETLLGPEDAVISDELNHASIIDGIRLSKAQRFRYKNNDMRDLEAQLVAAAGARFRLIATDGVFSMDGVIANLAAICQLADKHDALVMIDDSHGVGVLGPRARGTHEHRGVIDRVDIITGTLGKALGGASGGYAAGRKEIVELLRQRSRPYLFSNTVPPPIIGAAIKTIDLLSESSELRDRLEANTKVFRQGMADRGFQITPGEHPICPIMLGDAALAARMAEAMLRRGVYVIGFSYPVVPQGKARIRVQISAAHTADDLRFAMDAFAATKAELGI